MPIVRTEAEIMELVRKLLAKANDPASSDAEKELYLSEASAKMKRYQIDMAMLDASRTLGEKRTPIVRQIALFDDGSEWSHYFITVIDAIAETNGVRVMVNFGSTSMTIVGMQSDVEWTEMLWMNTFLEFVSRLDPRWDLNKTVPENIFIFKNAGFKWKEIWERGNQALQPLGMPDGMTEFIPGKCKYMINWYKAECKSRNFTPVGTQTFAAYRHTFTAAYTQRVCYRLEMMRAAAKVEEESVPGSSLALVDVKAQVDGEFYRLFDFMRPLTHEESLELLEASAARRRAEREADEAYLAGLTPEVRRKVLGARQEEARRQAKANERYWREQDKRNKSVRFDHAGFASGEAAANSVNLNRASATGAAPTKKGIS